MAEAILRYYIKSKKIKWWDVSSCGIHAEVGGTISENSRLALADMGIKVTNFQPRQLTQKLIESSALVVAMTSSQKQLLEGCGNVACINDFCGFDIPDPYGGNREIYNKTCSAIALACRSIIENYILKYEE